MKETRIEEEEKKKGEGGGFVPSDHAGSFKLSNQTFHSSANSNGKYIYGFYEGNPSKGSHEYLFCLQLNSRDYSYSY